MSKLLKYITKWAKQYIQECPSSTLFKLVRETKGFVDVLASNCKFIAKQNSEKCRALALQVPGS